MENIMLLNEIKKILECKVLTKNVFLEEDIKYCFAADLMSDVLRYSRTGSLLLTGITNIQVLQVSEILDLKGIIFVRGKVPEKDLIEQAESRHLPLLSTEHLLFDSCGILYENGLIGGKSRLTNLKSENKKDKQVLSNQE
jgi:predicted transcriptional regulator